VGPRDGLQNEKTVVPTHIKVEFISRLAAAGLRQGRKQVYLDYIAGVYCCEELQLRNLSVWIQVRLSISMPIRISIFEKKSF
jgi:hypothetical protein